MNINIATKEDFSRLEPLFLEVEHHHAKLEPEVFRPIFAYDRDHYDQLIENEQDVIFYSEINGEIAGVLVAVERSYPPIPMFVPIVFTVVEELSVAKKFRRQGVGKALMAFVEAWAKSRGRSQIQLSVWEKNTEAIGLYEALDYQRKVIRYQKDL